jgi:acyl CoA:acetate/3-ketoacid CoA transferase alpha subunit
MGLLLANRQVRRVVSSSVGDNREFGRQALARELELELVPQGAGSERAPGHGGQSMLISGWLVRDDHLHPTSPDRR